MTMIARSVCFGRDATTDKRRKRPAERAFDLQLNDIVLFLFGEEGIEFLQLNIQQPDELLLFNGDVLFPDGLSRIRPLPCIHNQRLFNRI